jgi:NAD(P)-dependent dehydrogenase (short-subunit alcohol dehydrogenase family)
MDNSTLFDVKVSLITKLHCSVVSGANKFQGKVVLVTGGAKGIGRMISEGFIQNGATVYISSRDAKACEEACKELNALGKGKADYIAADFYKLEELEKVADELKKRAGSMSWWPLNQKEQ